MEDFTRILIEWYNQNARELPWRQTTNPYYIWISEIILQQTRVNQGYGYYNRFIQKFPTIRSLAEASEDEVLHCWQGLGYYSRARNLHAAAQSMNGQFPHTYEKVLSLKGVGPYTAAAICSIAFRLPYAVVDGNVYRVLARYFGIETPIDSTEGKKIFSNMAQSLLDNHNPGHYNQAIMDFGAIQCTPVSPSCQECPLSDGCLAYTQGNVQDLPVKRHHTQVSNLFYNYIYVRSGENIWIHKRSQNDIWKSLYEIPLIKTEGITDTIHLLSLPVFQKFTHNAKGVELSILSKVKHILTHRIIHATFYQLIVPENTPVAEGYIEIPITKWREYAMPQLVYRFLEKFT